MRRVRAIIESEPLVPDHGKIAVPSVELTQGISLDKVHYSYVTERIAIRNLSLHIPAGESIGIVGPSGSGKSTLARLLVRLSDPQFGTLTLDGYPIRDYSLAALRQTICYVPQRPILFDGSVRDNLLYANPDATTEDLLHVVDGVYWTAFLRVWIRI
jgi:ABC-type multidrug transport system fused ATPase/permease subunit